MLKISKITLTFLMIAAAAALTGCGSKKSASTYKPRYEKVVYSFPQSDDDATQRLLSEAKMWLGTPYRYGGNDRGGVDCSGLVVQVYQRALGIKLPRVSREQADAVEAQSRERLLPGDLVFFATGRDPQRISHVGIFLGDGKMIHSSTKNGVVVADILSGYFDEHFRKAGRVPAFHSMRSSAASTKNKKEKPSKKKKEKEKEKSNAAKAAVAPVTPPAGAQIQPPMPEAAEVWQYEVVNSTPSSAAAATPSDPAPRPAPKKRKGQRSPTPPPAGATMSTPETSAPRTGSTSDAPTREAAPEPTPAPSAAAAPAPAKTEKPKASKPAKPALEKPAKPAKPAAKSPEPQNDSPATSTPDPDAARAKVLSRLKLD
ncbi:MAG: C40 family peptidase [Duncaniella sp.]|nr:C40 family peptidase [Duncaniella sp.]